MPRLSLAAPAAAAARPAAAPVAVFLLLVLASPSPASSSGSATVQQRPPMPGDWIVGESPRATIEIVSSPMDRERSAARFTHGGSAIVLLRVACAVFVTNVFGRTWFLAFVSTARCGVQVSFWATFLAMCTHVLIAAAVGGLLSAICPVWSMHCAAAAVFLWFTMSFVVECVRADSSTNAFKMRAEEAREAIGEDGESHMLLNTSLKRVTWRPYRTERFSKLFLAVFRSEWFGIAQITMVSLHASLSIVSVFVGSLAAFGLFSLSATMLTATFRGRKMSEKTIHGARALSFAICALIALSSCVRAQMEHGPTSREHDHQSSHSHGWDVQRLQHHFRHHSR